jgi:hypothetical protein
MGDRLDEDGVVLRVVARPVAKLADVDLLDQGAQEPIGPNWAEGPQRTG